MSLVMNVEMRVKVIAGINQYMKDWSSLQQKVQNAVIRYARTDIIARVFSMHNKCQSNNVKKKALLDLFNKIGLDSFNINHIIPLILSTASMDKSTMIKWSSITFNNVKSNCSHLLLLCLRTDPAADADSIINFKGSPKLLMGGGHHCCAVLDEWITEPSAGQQGNQSIEGIRAWEKLTEDAPIEEELNCA